MNQEDIIKLAREAGLHTLLDQHAGEYGNGYFENTSYPELERFAALIAAEIGIETHRRGYESGLRDGAAAECEKVAAWMIQRSYATGHGDTVEDLLKELEWQVREACARMIESAPPLMPFAQNDQGGCLVCGFTPKLAATAIRARRRTHERR